MAQELDLRVLFVGDERVALRWSLGAIVFEPVTYELWRSGNSETGYELIAGGLEVVAHLDVLELRSKFKPVFYKAVAIVGLTRYESAPAAITARPNEDSLLLQRRERYHLARREGVPAVLYTRRRSGSPCPTCVLSREAGAYDNDCRSCYGTGIKGGYYPAMPLYLAQQSLDQEGTNLTAERVIETKFQNLWTSNWSIINPEDVILEMVPPNHLWIINGVQRSSRLRSPVRQLLTAKSADKGTALYHLPIPDFPFQDQSEIFFQDLQGKGRDFDTVFAERIKAYVANLQPLDPDEPAAYQPPDPSAPPARNPESGIFS